ncbi:response regulator transcription factor [Nannocystis pusilla]|uniref:Response regulator transcription factor n=1 Tax=Nannocystis pusilla TaxID=889268 RepID=A0A9X3IWV1_9BACT|nr:response regulator transcription factor [Nannocystis pusilla]MCY1007767.1 response regulator transcription factor [Nannocystis pusilla]
MQTPAKVLLIEDDVRLAERTAEYLQGHELAVEIAGDGETGLTRALSGEFDVILLDLMLPRLDGLEVCRRLRQRSALPVIMLSARSEEIDRILGLELGADDYLPKPYSPRELVARIRAVLRRAVPSPEGPTSTLRCGPLVVDRARRRIEVAGAACDLTAHQFDLLWLLLEARGQVLSREQLYQRLRALRGQSPGAYDPSVDRSIDVQLSKIRGTLAAADARAAGLIRTVRGVGYVLDDAPEGAA